MELKKMSFGLYIINTMCVKMVVDGCLFRVFCVICGLALFCGGESTKTKTIRKIIHRGHGGTRMEVRRRNVLMNANCRKLIVN